MNLKNSNFFCKLIWLIIFFTFLNNVDKVNSSCANQLERCTSNVNPLLKDIAYMFPSTKEEVLRMCSIWSNIVDCVRHFAKICFNKKRKNSFNSAVEGPIGTVHSICVDDGFQKQYLQHATCLRDVSIRICKLNFNQLVDIVANPKSKDENICCAYSKFRKCVDPPLISQCGNVVKNLMDHSLTFLIQKCDMPDSSLSSYDDCQIPASLTIGSLKQRKLDDSIYKKFETNGGFYPIDPQLVGPYSARKQSENNNQASSNEYQSDNNESATKPVNKDLSHGVEDEFHLNNQPTNKFNRQDDEFETDKHRDYSTESPEYMMSHFSPEELHNNSHLITHNHYLVKLLFILYLIKNFF